VIDNEQTSNVYLWQTGPRTWMAYHPQSGFGGCGESRAEALDVFHRAWNDRSTVRVVEHAPPRARREDDPREPIPDEQQTRQPGYAVYKRLCKRFHSDVHPGAMFSADQVMVAVNELWTSMRGAK
jgi:hypothetical protein